MRRSTLFALPFAQLLLATLHGSCAGAEVRVQGSADDVRVEAHDASVAEIFAALGEHFAVHYRGTPASAGLTATFEGSLRQVVVRLLQGNDYVIKPGGGGLEVIVLGSAPGAATSPAPPGRVVVRQRDPFIVNARRPSE
jgi:hypothetical protein